MQNGKLNLWGFFLSSIAFSGQITAYGVWNNMRMSNDIHFWVNDYLNKTAECKKVWELTFSKDREEHTEAAQFAGLVGPHSDHAHSVVKRDVVGNSAAELGLQIFNGITAFIDCNKVLLTLIWVLQLILQKAEIDLWVRYKQWHLMPL